MNHSRRPPGLVLAALALTAQMSLAAPPVAAAQNTNSSIPMGRQDANVGIPYNPACKRRCDRDHRRCVARGRNRTACRRQLRNCLRRCPQ